MSGQAVLVTSRGVLGRWRAAAGRSGLGAYGGWRVFRRDFIGMRLLSLERGQSYSMGLILGARGAPTWARGFLGPAALCSGTPNSRLRRKSMSTHAASTEGLGRLLGAVGLKRGNESSGDDNNNRVKL